MLEEDAVLATNCDFEELVLVVPSPENSQCVRFGAESKAIGRGKRNLRPSVALMHLEDS